MPEATTAPDPWDVDDPSRPAESPPDENPADKMTHGDEESSGVSITADAPAKEPAKKAAPAAKKASPAPSKTASAPKPAPPPSAPKKRGPLGATLADMATYVTALYWGPEGTGKTTDALRMTELHPKKRVILIDAEGGAKVAALKQRGIDVSRIEVWPRPEDGGPAALNFEGLFDLAEDLGLQWEEYIGWVWDSGTEITKRLLDQVTGDARAKDAAIGKQRGRFQVNLEDHGVASSMLRELLRKFRDLPMHGVITALERRDIDNDTGKVKYGPNMSPAMANDAAGLVDLVIYKTVDMIGENPVRSGHTLPTKTRRAKDRFGVLPPKLADPYFDRVVGYVNGELTRENDPVQTHIREMAKAVAEAAANPKGNANAQTPK